MKRMLSILLACLLLLTSCGGEAKATTMHLKRTEGRVNIANSEGKDLEPRDDLGLYSGYEVDTKSDSYAWIDLDEVKLTKLDEKSEIEIKKDGKDLEIIVSKGSLFFNVTEPLADDETMTIRASTMTMGIRGTCGWVEVPDKDTMRVFLLEGKVRCETDDDRETIQAGEMATMTEDGTITVEEFTAADIPTFVMEEIEDDDDLMEAIPDAPGTDDPLPLISFTYKTNDWNEYGYILAFDQSGTVVWEYTTPQLEIAQLERVSDIGLVGSGYCFIFNGSVICLDARTGEELWRNSEFGGAGARSLIDNGVIYLCGFFGPDLFVVSADGNTIKRFDSLDNDYYWPYKLELSGDILTVTMDGGPEGDLEMGHLIRVNIKDWSIES